MKREQIMTMAIRYLKEVVITCDPKEECLRCDEGREIVKELESLTQQDEPSCKRCGGTGMIPMRAGGYDWCPECGGKKEKR